MVGRLFLLSSLLLSAVGCAFRPNPNSDRAPADGRLVARTDYSAPAAWEPPVVQGRAFWNMLDHKQRQWEGIPQYTKHINTEPMVYESAVRYSLGRLLGRTNDPLRVCAGSLQPADARKAPFPADVPFLLCGIRVRPPFRTLMPFRADKAGFAAWKKRYPNFLGFEAGTEWDPEVISFLNRGSEEQLEGLRRQFLEDGYTEADAKAAVDRTRTLLETSRKGRAEAAAGLKTCFDALRGYCFGDPLEWGAAGATLETTNTGPYRHQVSLAFIRGAARQYRKFWSWYIALCYNGTDSQGVGRTDQTPYYTMTAPTIGKSLGKDYGMSVSLNRRDMYLAYLSGATFVAHEVWPYAYCQLSITNKGPWDKEQEWILSPHGEAMKEWYAFATRHPRGAPYAPVALAVPFSQGMSQAAATSFSRFPAQRPDTMIDAFFYTLFPYNQDTKRGQEGCLANSPYGDLYDVLVLDPPSGPPRRGTLEAYKALILLGRYEFDRKAVARLKQYVSSGGTLVLTLEQLNERFDEDFIGLVRSGQAAEVQGPVRDQVTGQTLDLNEPYDYVPIELRGGRALWEDASGAPLAVARDYGKGRVITTLVDWMMPRGNVPPEGTAAIPSAWLQSLWNGRDLPFVRLLMDAVVRDVLPVAVEGDIQFGLNKRPDGWLVYLINNKGVTKWTDTPEVLDPAAAARVTVTCAALGAVGAVTELRGETPIVYDQARRQFEVEVGPGDVRVVWIETPAAPAKQGDPL